MIYLCFPFISFKDINFFVSVNTIIIIMSCRYFFKNTTRQSIKALHLVKLNKYRCTKLFLPSIQTLRLHAKLETFLLSIYGDVMGDFDLEVELIFLQYSLLITFIIITPFSRKFFMP